MDAVLPATLLRTYQTIRYKSQGHNSVIYCSQLQVSVITESFYSAVFRFQ